jgi:hypothetical protein
MLIPNENRLTMFDLPVGTKVKMPELALHDADPDDVWEITSHGEFVELRNQDGEEGGCGGDLVPKMISTSAKGARPPGSGIPLKTDWSDEEQGKLYIGLPTTPGGPPRQEALVQPNIPDREKRLAEIARKRRMRSEEETADESAQTDDSEEIVFLKDKEWKVIENGIFRIKHFTPWAKVEDGRVVALTNTTPYASLGFESSSLPNATGFITHKLDFLHLWKAFEKRGVGEDEEVLFTWTTTFYKWYFRFLPKAGLPKLVVMVCRKGSFELITDDTFMPELTPTERFDASSPIVEWKPDAME